MMRWTILIATAVLLALTSATGYAQEYHWTISASSTDPDVNVADAQGTATFHLWLACSNLNVVDGMAAAEFDLSSSSVIVLAFVPANGFLNAGSAGSLLLAIGGCPPGPIRAGEILTSVSGPGSICFAPSQNGDPVTVDCQQASPVAHDINWTGIALNGGTACSLGSGCSFDPISVESESWSAIKGMYR